MSEGNPRQDAGGADQFALPSIIAAAHELKTPLAIMRQLALTIQEGTADSSEIITMAERIGMTSDRALRLTNDLTRGSRLQDSLFELEPLDVAPLCRDVVQELSPLYAAKGQTLNAKIHQRGLPLVIAHRDLLRRILVNFVDNALYYAESDTPVELFVTYKRNQDTIRLGVRDRGPTVSRAFLRSLDRPKSITYRPESSGLGLYLAKQFADAMDARVGVTRHRDGVSFYVDMARSSQMRLL